MTGTIARLESLVCRLTTELLDAKALLYDAKVAVCGVAIGDIVVKSGKRYRVVDIDVHWTTSPPWLRGVQQLKDGSWGTASRNLYDGWVKEN